MSETLCRRVADDLGLRPPQVQAVADLLADGGTVPFIARYRKERTGSLDEVAITAIRDRLGELTELDKRRAAIIKSLEERGLLTAELQQALAAAATLAQLEDIYLPLRPKRRTRASLARDRGLEPLAQLVFAQDPGVDPTTEAIAYVDEEKEIASPAAALQGARDIIAEWINEDAAARGGLRRLFADAGIFQSRAIEGKQDEGAKFRDYFAWQEPASRAPSHRILALFRGEREGYLRLALRPDEDGALSFLRRLFVKGESPCGAQVALALTDGYQRLLAPSLENEARNEAKRRADAVAIEVFARNLRESLLEAPLGQKIVLAIDPGFRTGCKIVCLDRQGKLLHHGTIYPTQSARQREEARTTLEDLIRRHGVEAVAIGNGTAGRETETFVRSLDLSLPIVLVNESGASVYSASEVARREFPDLDLTVRGAVSIGRRLMDPLSELVKIDPKALGVGQYQHDVDQGKLKQSLDDTVTSCVNAVGVEVNTASRELLAYVSGLGPVLAANIVTHRNANGPFHNRQALLAVKRLGPKAFQQAAGFLRIRDADNPLDASGVHPESYTVVDRMARDLDCAVADLLADPEARQRIDLHLYVDESIGLPTLTDILAELARPGRDPRAHFETFVFAKGVTTLDDLEPGMKIPGVVTNVTNFGAFVDIGIHQDGLVHISQLADRYVTNVAEVVKVQQKVMVTVLEVDKVRRRISLSLRENPQLPGSAPER